MDYCTYENGVESNCCGTQIKWGDICCACGEHCEAVDLDEYENDEIKEDENN